MSERSADEDDQLGPPWTFAKIMVGTLPESKKRECREKHDQEEVEDAE